MGTVVEKIISLPAEPAKPGSAPLLDLNTYEGAVGHIKAILDMVRANFENDGEIMPVTFLMVSCSPEDGTPLPQTGIAIVAPVGMFDDGAGKEKYSQMLKALIVKTKAVGVIFVSEVWMTETDDSPDAKKLLKEFVESGKSIRDYPGRYEAVFVTLEHAKGPGVITFVARITRPEGKPPVLEEFKDGGFGGKFEGRFVGLLHNMN